jgi:hypothetical protein
MTITLDPAPSTKKPYRPPILSVYGGLAQMTFGMKFGKMIEGALTMRT